ncbi:cAMP-binding domain of CRP or a regulatory subunit of cAMP-dependent protein kinases [Chitinophaga terrae (ex Kim and Jung 2007)]|jgi:CRP-like cAMP-binding protein|uniref:cAMP-binding domain of CRP or a regulatory subunit of cAMP-dependent protein kinases n=1 Tax=Chitinophaga terrae (ex Kim and Jung 2007) TaxID=408074 RepID=A0A1H4GEQ2_9BACT|nr:Crp/Fnr family transcriptional regulator [Chitinophaga terrae (ex Kim and Jung 2007)]MDQ0110028.1 CRP-like cAMP-binding protein [Chitinophaga terrae (ex Kim and Jung 2007)]GEP93357.1 cAMP-binding protein [Chitinophaga terrae (ex Kim and Jung 2007)]SEB08103.1 cAMP-binding domain of CRP or a regulatory subunit of cAMP-dependent protein kinases [Chitinophaga terrae (ex Kim and Jung 2007)]
MTVLQTLLEELSGVLPGNMTSLFALTRQVKLEEGEAYIREGDKSRRLAFIEKGIIRAYTLKQNGDEATLFLRWEGHFVASHDTIIHSIPARFTYRALEACSLIEIDYDELDDVLRRQPELEHLRNYFLLKMLSDALEGLEGFVLLSHEERYQRLLENRWDIVNRVPDKYIASMLGITPVSLSRIRKRIHNKGRNQG